MLTRLEKDVLEKLLDDSGEPFATMREQLACAKVVNREFTGVGFFTEFALPEGAPVKRDLPDMAFGDVCAEFPELRRGAGFVLFIRGGIVAMLEGYTYDEAWPSNADEFRLSKSDRPLHMSARSGNH